MARQDSRTFDFDAVIKDTYLNIRGYAVIAMKNSVGYELVERLVRVLNVLKTSE